LYRIDNENYFDRQQKYKQRGGCYGLSPEDVSTVSELVEERSRYKRISREYHKSDEITQLLKLKYKVKVNDKNREWSVVVSNWDNMNMNNVDGNNIDDNQEQQNIDTSFYYVPSPLVPNDHPTHTMNDDDKAIIKNNLWHRSMARHKKKYLKADQIRDELMDKYSILIDDRTREWSVVDNNNENGNENKYDPFVRGAELSQKSAYLRRQGEEEDDDDDDEDANNNNKNNNNDGSDGDGDDEVKSTMIGSSSSSSSSSSKAVDDALSEIFSNNNND